ncbi:MAG: hypothetical protein QMD82_01760 [bacterium]|nr:hypothetical protein [bacterium]
MALFLSFSFYDPIFLKDYSVEFLELRKSYIKRGSDTYVWTFADTSDERPFIKFSPSLKLINITKGRVNYTNSYINFAFDAGVSFDQFQVYTKVNFFNFVTPYKFQFYEPLADNRYNLYSFDEQPVIGGTSLFDINVEKAYIRYSTKNFEILVGRNNVMLGEALLFSGLCYPLDHLYRLSFSFSKFKVVTAFAVTQDTFPEKTISYQTLEWKPLDNLTVTFYEAVSHTGEDYFKYFNPISLYYERQRRGISNSDNLLGGLAVRFDVKERVSLFFDFLNDDFIVFQGGTSKYGICVGLETSVDFYSFLRFSFVAIPRFTYTHVSDTNAWQIMGLPLGYPRGNDLLDLYLSYFRKLKNDGYLVIRVAQLNKGEGTLKEHWENSGYPKNMPFPSGQVERELFTMLGYKKKRIYTGLFTDWKYNRSFATFGVFIYFKDNVFKVVF